MIIGIAIAVYKLLGKGEGNERSIDRRLNLVVRFVALDHPTDLLSVALPGRFVLDGF